MKKRWFNAWKELQGNRGSGVVLVMVMISCITMMVVSLMLLSYTNFKIKASERMAKADLYAAEAKMEQLVGCLQNVTSASIAEAHKQTLAAYITQDGSGNELSQDSVNTQNRASFQNAFLDELEKRLKSGSGTYSGEALRTLMGDSTVGIANDADCAYTIDTTEKTFTLKNIRLTYESERSGSTITIQTDIVISAPSYYYVKSNAGANDDGKWEVEKLVEYENWSTIY